MTVVVVGGGPAGLTAARQLCELGVPNVLVVEREREAGGIPRHSNHPGFGMRDLHQLLTGPMYARALHERAAAAGAEILTSATVTGWNSQLTVDITSREGRLQVPSAAIVLATGCRERPRSARLVAGDRPAGVMTTGQLQQMVTIEHMDPGSRAVVVGAEHVSYSAVLTLAEAGCRTVGMLTSEPRHTTFGGFDMLARMRYRVPVAVDTSLIAIVGRHRVQAVTVHNERSGITRDIDCDTVVFTGDWIADHELARRHHIDVDPASSGVSVDGALRSGHPGVFAAGNVVHPAETADICALDGHHVATSVVQWLQDEQWPKQDVALRTQRPLLWIAPNRISGSERPPRHRFTLRSSSFERLPHITVTQGDRRLWRSRVPWLVPTRPAYLSDTWLADVDRRPGAPDVYVSS